MLFGILGGKEVRSQTNTVGTTSSSEWNYFFGQAGRGIHVDEAAALGVPAIWNAINVIAGTIAHLPLHLYKIDKDGNPQKVENTPLATVVHDYVNEYHSKFDFWKLIVSRAYLNGRGLAIILRDKAKRPAGFVPVDENTASITQTITDTGEIKRTYFINGKPYDGADILDIAPMLKADGVTAYSPITTNRNAIAAIIAAETYASAMLANGGVPPILLSGPQGSPEARDRAEEQINGAIKIDRNGRRPFLHLPTGFDMKPLGFEPQKQQLIEARKWMVSEVSRIFNIAPALLHDLTTGTYSNVEQQSLNFVQQTILPLAKLIEQQLNLKLFGKRNTSNYVEFNVDGLVRGDLKSRMEALARAVNASLLTPNEARALDNRPPKGGGDELYIQGATVPLQDAGKNLAQPAPAPTDNTNNTNSGDANIGTA